MIAVDSVLVAKSFIATDGGVALVWFHIRALIAIDTPPSAPDRGLLSSRGLVFAVMVQDLVCVWGVALCLAWCLVVWWWWRCMKCLGEDCLTNILLASPAWNSIFWWLQYLSQFVAAGQTYIPLRGSSIQTSWPGSLHPS